MNAIFYVLRGGMAWRLLPNDLPPRTTVYRWFSSWRDTGLFETINHLLVMADRERSGRDASPSAAVIDSQTRRPRAGGRGLILEPQPADVQDRDGGQIVLRLSRRSFPFIARAFADMGFAGDGPGTATPITVQIVRKLRDQVGVAVHPRRWVIERFFRVDQPKPAALEGP
jgi:transposase